MSSNHEATLRERIHYRMDNYLAKGSSALFLSLLITFLVSFAIIAILRLMFHYFVVPATEPNGEHWTWLRHIYTAFLELTAPGNMNQDVKTPPIFKVGAIFAGLTGLVIFSTLIATLTTALHQAIAQLKQGHSRVLESGHTLILGWTHRVPEIIKEMVEANEAESDPVIVIMADEDKPEMDAYLMASDLDFGNTRVVTRHGQPSSPESLEKVSVDFAKSVIVLATADDNAPHHEHVASDARVIKAVLALETAAPDADFPIVTELFLARNRNVVKNVAPGRTHMVDAEEILAKVMVQTSRTSGLSVVYSELLSFEGCELYFYEGNWNGVTFGDAQFHFPDGVPIGVRRPDGAVEIRPSLETVLEPGFEVLIVAEDDSTIDFKSSPVAVGREINIPDRRTPQNVEKLLLVGWSPKAPIIISEYSEYVLEGSEVCVVVRRITPEIEAQSFYIILNFIYIPKQKENLTPEIHNHPSSCFFFSR